jgi:hypothetical protein
VVELAHRLSHGRELGVGYADALGGFVHRSRGPYGQHRTDC